MDENVQEVIYIDRADPSRELETEIPILLENNLDKGPGIPTDVMFYLRTSARRDKTIPVKPGASIRMIAVPRDIQVPVEIKFTHDGVARYIG